MRKNLISIFIYMLLVSCGDFLEPKSTSEFVPKDATSLNEIILGDAYPRPDDRIAINTFLGVFEDDVTCSDWAPDPNNEDKLPALEAAYAWQPDMFERFQKAGIFANTYNIWQNIYRKLLGANAVLDYIGDASGTEHEKSNVKAQGCALRAFYHFYLVNIFGVPYNDNKIGPGIPIRTSSGMEDKEMKRNTVEEVYRQIVSDLLEAEKQYKTLPADKQWQMDFRTSLPMVQLLLSRVYLYMEDWENAALYAEKVINDWNFRLHDLNSLPEPTFMEPYYNFISSKSSECIWLFGSSSDMNYFIDEEWNVWDDERCILRVSDDLLNSYIPGDLRKERYMVQERWYDEYYKPFSKVKISYRHYPESDTEFARAFRLPEAYLNLAEAKAMLYKINGDAAARTVALEKLNYLRLYRFDPEQYEKKDISNPDDLVTFIREERRRELCFENHRWFDLRRYGMPEIRHKWSQDENVTVEYVLKAKDPGYTIPIPPEALEKNKALEQNVLAPVR